MKEIRENCRLDMRTFDLDMSQQLLRLFNTPEKNMVRPRHVGLTFTLRLVLSHPYIKLTPEFETCFGQWVSGLSNHPSQKLNDEEKWVMCHGIDLYDGAGSLHYRSLEIILLLRSVAGSNTHGQNTGSCPASEEDVKTKNDLELIMSRTMTYMTLAETAIRSIVVTQINPHHYVQNVPPGVNPSKISRDNAAVGESLRKLTSTLTSTHTPDFCGVWDQLTTFFMYGWNSWKVAQSRPDWRPSHSGGWDESVFFGGLLDSLTQQGKPAETLTLVKETREFLSQRPRRGNEFRAFFPKLVMAHALSLGPESGSQKESLLLESEAYLMGIYRAQDNNPQGPPTVRHTRVQVDEGVLPHLFNCLAQLGRYQSLHGIVAELGSLLRNWTTDVTVHRIQPYVHLSTALLASVKGMDFPLKGALLEATFGLPHTLVKLTLGLGVYENIRTLRNDAMGALIHFSFETGMTHALAEFLAELEESLVQKYGEDRVGPIITTLLCFGERVVDGLEHVGQVKMANADWSAFLEQVKCSVVKWTGVISTPEHVHEKKSWMDGTAEVICRHCDSFLEVTGTVGTY